MRRNKDMLRVMLLFGFDKFVLGGYGLQIYSKNGIGNRNDFTVNY